MARLFGLSGRVTGRKGDTVFSVRKGEQIIRQYNPMVLNPNTEAQTVQRAKMKLSSQLGAIFANVIAIPSEGAKTSRNIFTKINFQYITRDTSVEGIKVQADLPNLQLTKSGRSMIPFGVVRDANSGKLICALTQDGKDSFTRVVYVMMAVLSDGTIMYLDSKETKEARESGIFPVQFDDPNENVLVYAYGIQDLNAMASTLFDNTQYEDGTEIASLISGRKVSAVDAQVSMTAGMMFEKTDTIKLTQGEADGFVLNAHPEVATLDLEGFYYEGIQYSAQFTPVGEGAVKGWLATNGKGHSGEHIGNGIFSSDGIYIVTPFVGAANKYYIGVIADDCLDITGAGEQAGTTGSVTATPKDGFVFEKWIHDTTETTDATISSVTFSSGFAWYVAKGTEETE